MPGSSKANMTPLFLLRTSNGVTILLVDVDDIIISSTYPDGILPLQKELHASLHMKDLHHLTYFLGLEVHKLKGGLFINQYKYTKDLIAQAQLQNTMDVDTPPKLNVKYQSDD